MKTSAAVDEIKTRYRDLEQGRAGQCLNLYPLRHLQRILRSSIAAIRREALRPRNHALFGLVRAAIWHRRLPDAAVALITMIFYFMVKTDWATNRYQS